MVPARGYVTRFRELIATDLRCERSLRIFYRHKVSVSMSGHGNGHVTMGILFILVSRYFDKLKFGFYFIFLTIRTQ